MARKGKSPEVFWQEFEENTGEKVMARGLGRYVSGWNEFDSEGTTNIWGLIIATSGGFRFYHFPQANWLTALTRFGSSGDTPKEKTIFIPSDDILSAVLHKETKWYKKIFSSAAPRLLIRYRSQNGSEKELTFNADYKPDAIAEALCPADSKLNL
jgi:hypothetical protein